MKQFGKRLLRKLLEKESSPYRLARSIAVGAGIATSPYYTLQTWLIFPFCWVFSANVAVAMIVLWTVNTPWTMLPFILSNYFVGHILFEWLLEWDLSQYNPSWMEWVNNKIGPYITPYFGIDEICLWCFLIGGTVVGVCVGIASYWLVLPILRRRLSAPEKQSEENN